MTESTRLLTASQAAARLGVKTATLYAYVSRGLLPRTKAADGRMSLFDARDIARLERRSGRRHGSPSEVVVASELTLVDADAGRLYYRGLDAIELCTQRRFEEVAGFLWNGNFDGPGAWYADERSKRAGMGAVRKGTPLGDELPVIASTIAALPSKRSPAAQAIDVMSCLVDCLPPVVGSPGSSFASRLHSKLSPNEPRFVRVLDVALSLTAEHGLTYSSLVARVVAASGGSVASAVASAFGAALPSVRASCFTDLEQAFAIATDIGAARAARELRPDAIAAATLRDPYPSGDPRGRVLLELMQREAPEAWELVRDMTEEVRARGGGPPTAVYAQAALSWLCGMRPGSGEVISLLSRAAGWIAHIFEEYRRPTPFRPRIAYTGPSPRSTPIRTLDAVVSYLSR